VLNEGYWIWVHVCCFVRDWLVHAEGIIRWGCPGLGSFQGVWRLFSFEGVKNFVGKDSMVIVEVVVGCVFDVYMEFFDGVQMCSFLLVI
jgi:hypothetical protein